MYGIDDEQIQQLLGFKSPEENFQAQGTPQLEQGLLGNVSVQNPNQRQASTAAAQMAQVAQNANQSLGSELAAQRQAATQQTMQQALAQQQQQKQQSGQILGALLKMYLTGGKG